MDSAGIHCIAELYDCPRRLLDDEAFVCNALRRAVDAGFATLISSVSHRFQPQGVTALALIAESHVAIHTWPEFGYAAVDAFTCGDQANAMKACEYLIDAFEAGRHSLRKIARGTDVRPDNSEAPAVATTSDAFSASGA